MKKFSSESLKYTYEGNFMKVLLVDDYPLFLELSKIFLKVFHGITSDTVNSAKEALTKLEKDSYDVIVSDYDMPFIDGIKFLRTIRNKKISIPLFCSLDLEKRKSCTWQ
jgi:CheY-like chemotaxis protein